MVGPGSGAPDAHPLRVMVVDDDPVLLRSFSGIVESLPEVELVAATRNGEDALDVLASGQVDVVLLDVEMPGLGGIEAARRIRDDHPGVTVVMLTAFRRRGSLGAALAAGAKGFLTKDMPMKEIIARARRAVAGEVVMGAEPTAILARAYTRALLTDDEAEFLDLLEALPNRLVPVLEGIIAGLTNGAIAAVACLAESTAKLYVSQLLEETGCRSRTELAVKALRCGYGGGFTHFGGRE